MINPLWLQRKEKKREIRLREKAQKARCIDDIDEVVEDNATWNRRFGDIQKRRVR
ncbi:MAG: hypothetical protein ACYTFQ_10610 [Planctomycetota bacterium]|jgi:hypothetical protein